MRTMRVLIGMVSVVCLLLTSSALAFDLIGHRGARGLAPENTLPSFARALSLGVTVLELDTAITKDGVIVISHDPSLNPNITRDKDGKWLAKPGPAIHSLTFNELQQYDVGRLKPNTNYAKSFPEQKSVDGTRIPRLADLFALVKKSGNEQVRFNIELKVSPTQARRNARSRNLHEEGDRVDPIKRGWKPALASSPSIGALCRWCRRSLRKSPRSISPCSSAPSTIF